MCPVDSPNHLAWDGTHLWIRNNKKHTFHRVTTTGTIVSYFRRYIKYFYDVTWNGTHLVVISLRELYYLTTKGVIVSRRNIPEIGISITWDGTDLWYNGTVRGRRRFGYRLCKIDPAGNYTLVVEHNYFRRIIRSNGYYLWQITPGREDQIRYILPGPRSGRINLRSKMIRNAVHDGTFLWIIDSTDHRKIKINRISVITYAVDNTMTSKYGGVPSRLGTPNFAHFLGLGPGDRV